MKAPFISVNLTKLRENTDYILDACRRHGVTLAGVTKVFCAQERITEALKQAGVPMMADARLENIARLPGGLPHMLLRLSDPHAADEVVRLADISLQSEHAAIHALAEAAKKAGRRHQVVLMIDLGDLREGLFHKDREKILQTARAVAEAPWLELAGTGTNLTCFGGILPDDHNLGVMLEITDHLRRELNLPLPLVSGGNSSSLHLLFEGRLPKGINHLRIGEGMLLGMDTAVGKPFPFLHQDVFTLSARLVEVQNKPSKPEGSTGPNAFGEHVTFPDLGPMRRGILAVGRQDTDAEGLTARDPRIKLLGASSDHLIVGLTQAPDYQVGDLLHFTPDYGALLKAYTSPYVNKAEEA